MYSSQYHHLPSELDLVPKPPESESLITLLIYLLLAQHHLSIVFFIIVFFFYNKLRLYEDFSSTQWYSYFALFIQLNYCDRITMKKLSIHTYFTFQRQRGYWNQVLWRRSADHYVASAAFLRINQRSLETLRSSSHTDLMHFLTILFQDTLYYCYIIPFDSKSQVTLRLGLKSILLFLNTYVPYCISIY